MNNDKVYIIAEIGINHNGSLENCFKMIDIATDAGAQAAKFQFFKAKFMYPPNAGRLSWKDNKINYSYDIYKAVERFELPAQWIDKIIQYCNHRGIEFLSSVFDIKGANFLIKKGVKKIKLSSYTVTNIPLIRHCAKAGLPIILSVGGAVLGEVEEAVEVITQNNKNLSLLHCSLSYPTKLNDCNLGVIETLKNAFSPLSIGWSDHTAEVSVSAVQAVYLGAKIIEKHITLSKTMPGPDHFFALEPQELKQMVTDIRQAESAVKKGGFKINRRILGSTAKRIYAHEKYLREFTFTKIFSKKTIQQGQRIHLKEIVVLRPGKNKGGLAPKYLEFFAKYKIICRKNLSANQIIDWDAIL